MKKILGLDIGTTSIGWAIVEAIDEKNINDLTGKIVETDINNERIGIHKDAVGVRIISQDTDNILSFNKGEKLIQGSTLTPTASRRVKRGGRRLKSRYKLRRGKLENILIFLGIIKDERYYTNERINDENGKRIKRGDGNDIGKAIYELRDKAIRHKISMPELGRILLHLNQWRGYSSDRFAKEEKQKFDYYTGKVVGISEQPFKIDYDKADKTKVNWFHYLITIELEEPIIIDSEKSITQFKDARLFVKEIEKFTIKKGEIITFKFIERDTKEKGKIIDSYYQIQPTIPDPTDWNYKYQMLQKTLNEWCSNGGNVGAYFYHNFYETQTIQRIRNHVVNRSWYEDELNKIWDVQFEFNKSFFEHLNIEEIVKVAFKDYQPILNDILKKDGIKEQLKCLIRDKIIFFQRPWQQAKKKGQCLFEKIKVKKERAIKGTGKKEIVEEYVGRTVIPRSHPLFQEFKIWQQINNVRLFYNGENGKIDLFESNETFKSNTGMDIKETKQKLFNSLQESKTISWRSFVKEELGIEPFEDLEDKSKRKTSKKGVNVETGEIDYTYYSVNFRKRKKDGTYEDIKLKGNTTKVSIKNILYDKSDNWFNQIHSEKQNISNIQLLWEIIYDITNSDAKKVALILKSHFDFDDVICSQLANLKLDDVGMASLSAKAIRQILPLISDGKDMTEKTLAKVNSLIALNNNEQEKSKDEKLESLKDFIPDKKARIRLSNFNTIEDFTYLNYWEASAVRYGSHSTKKSEANGRIKPVENHSMNNPVVEKIVNETIRIVNEINDTYGFDEVRIELSRELKASMDERQQIWESMDNNAKKNEWAKQMLRELKQALVENDRAADNIDSDTANKSNIDKIKIVEDVVKFKNANEYKLKEKEYRLSEPTKAEVKKYLMWLEQNFKCPYTNQPIPFTDVFARGKVVEIEHIIPRERYYLNSYINKVITWREVNQAKADYGNRTAYEFIVSKRKEEIIKLSNGKDVSLVLKESWESHVKSMFPKGGKQANLLRKEIPEDPINRTLNETQYINKKLKEKLGELVGEQKVWVTSGAVTDILRDRWHLNSIMKELMRYRFENFEIPTGKKIFKLKSLVEQQAMFDKIKTVIESPEDFEVYKIPSGKKFIEIKDIEELKKIQGELELLINENSIDPVKKIKPFDYATSDDAFETKNLTHYIKQFNNKSGNYEDKEVFEGYTKRLDHRHHALDAIIIACTKQNHIQYINTLNAINSADQESDESKKAKYQFLKEDICIGNSSKRFKTPWIENKFLPEMKKAMSEIAISHKNTRLLISPSKHRVNKDIKPNKIASIRGELHKETNYGHKNYFIEGGKTFINKLIPQILKDKVDNQLQTRVHFKTFEEIIKETVLKEKYQQILISLFQPYENETLNDKNCKEYSKAILKEILTKKLLINSQTNDSLLWLSTYSDKDKSARPMGLSMDLNKGDIIEKIADPRIKRLATYRFKYVNKQKAAIDKLDLETQEKNKCKREVETLKLYSNAIYEVRIKYDDADERLKRNEKPYQWIELKDYQEEDFNKIWYAKDKTTEIIKTKLKERNLEKLKQTYFSYPLFISAIPIEIKKTSLLFASKVYEITKGRYVDAVNVFMTYFFKEKGENRRDAERSIEFLKLLDAVRIVSFEKPDKLDYSTLISKPTCDLIFTLAKNDLVYLPNTRLTDEQLDDIDWNNKESLMPYLYIVKDMNPSRNEIKFQQFYKADSIKISEADSKSLFNNPELKEQIEGIKYGDTNMWKRCIKVFTDKLGKKIVPYWDFPNGCWDSVTAKKLGLVKN